MQRDDAWLAKVRAHLMTWPREKLIGWLQWNDGNGIWSDEDMIANDMEPMTVKDAVEQVMMFVEENRETPEEMMQGSLEANPDRYPKHDQFDPWLRGSPMPKAQAKGYDALRSKDPAAAQSLKDMLGADVHAVVIDVDGPDGYTVTHPTSGETWEYDGANDMWMEV